MFVTNVMDTVKLCQDYIDVQLLSIVIEKQRDYFWPVLVAVTID